MELPDIIDEVSHLDAGARALWFEGRWYTWAELNAHGDAVLAQAARAGLARDESLGVILRNDPLCVAVLLSAFRARRPVLTFSPLLPDAALADDIRACRPGALAALPADWDRPGLLGAVQAAGAAGLRIGEEGAPRVPSTGYGHSAANHSAANHSAANHSAPDHGAPDHGADNHGAAHHTAPPGTAASMLTSGTTGAPKRVAVTLAGLAHAVHAATVHHEGERANAPLRLRDATSIIDLPLFNVTSYLDIAMTVAAGRRICLMRRFEPRAWAEAVREHRVVVALLVPAAMRMVLDAGVPRESLASLRVVRSGSAPLDPDLAEAFEARYGVPVIVSYGATEFSGALAGLTMRDRRQWGNAKRGSVGRPHPGVELRIVDPADGRDLGPGPVGVLEARAPQIAGADLGAWTRTNDLARIDHDGFLFIEGRADDVIIRGGFKIDPRTVADALRQHPQVADAAVIALPDPRLGQVPGAAVVLADDLADWPGADLQADLQAWVRARQPPYAVPVTIRRVDALPRTPTLKVAKGALAEILRVP